MSTSLPIITPQDTVEKSMQLLNTHKTRYLLVFDDQEFKGVITINDVLREAIANKEMIFDELAVKKQQKCRTRSFNYSES
jgi:CBS-domain-containing membrane protein